MKQIISFLAFVSILFLVSCSDIEQDSLPVVPEFQKTTPGYQNTNGTYEYLQCFEFIPVHSVQSSTTRGSIDIIISPQLFPKHFVHMFVALEFKNSGFPLQNKMIFVGKPSSNIIKLDDVNANTLKSVKVYAYIPGIDWRSITPPYNYLESFKELTVDEWNTNSNQLFIYTQDWTPNLSDTFVELTIGENGNKSQVLTYIAKPMEGKMFIPKITKERITQVKLYGIFNEQTY